MPSPLTATAAWPGVITHYRDRVQITQSVAPVTLLEGNTPLIPAPALARALGQGKAEFELFLKFEASNPTGSFKDRGMTAAISSQAESGAATWWICSSSATGATPPPLSLIHI